MDNRKKRHALLDYCAGHDGCEDCALYGSRVACDFLDAPEEQVELWFAKVMASVDKEEAGKGRVFDSGARRDDSTGKGRFDLLPWGAVWEVAKHSQRGAEHYGTHNVDKGIPTSCLLDSCIRHLCKHLMGWDDEEHLVAAAWNALWAVQMTLTNPEMVDTPWRGEA